jgi:hypothetical protein
VPVVRKLAGRRSLYAVREYNHGHIKARELREALPPEAFDGFFKFAFVRNPWDWHDVPLPHLNRSAHADFHEYY